MSRRRHRNVITAALAAPFAAALVAFVVTSCGNTEGDNAVRGDASGDSTNDSAGGDSAARDGAADSSTEFDAAHPDGGPAPVVACGDGGADAAGECTLPPSVCIDEHWLRYYGGSASCTDAGVCDFMAFDMLCPHADMAPDCFQGGCRIVIVR